MKQKSCCAIGLRQVTSGPMRRVCVIRGLLESFDQESCEATCDAYFDYDPFGNGSSMDTDLVSCL